MLSQDEVECEYRWKQTEKRLKVTAQSQPETSSQVILVTTWWEFGGLRCWPAKNMGELSPAQPVPSSWVQNLPSELSKLWQNSLKKWTTWTTAIYTFLRSNTWSHTVNSGCWPLAMLWRQTRNDWLEHLWEHPSYWPWQRDMLQREAHLNFLNASTYCSKWSWPDLPQSLSVGAHLGWMEYDGICWNHQTPCKHRTNSAFDYSVSNDSSAPPHQIHLRYHQHHLHWRSIKARAQMQTRHWWIFQILSDMAGQVSANLIHQLKGPQWLSHCLSYLPGTTDSVSHLHIHRQRRGAILMGQWKMH